MVLIKGKWALVTGAARGIGYLSAKFLACYGCNIVVHSRQLSHTETLLTELKEYGVDAYAVEAELSDPASVQAMLTEIERRNTPIEIVLNNAGMQIAYRESYYQTPVSDYTESFMVNTIAPAMICYHFLPKMIAKGFGRIVNTTSGIRLEPEQAGYSASKAALDKITIDLASKIDGTDVMLNLVDPGWCRTDLGGPNAPNAPGSVLPGIVLGVFLDDHKSGRLLNAQDYHGLTLEQAIDTFSAQ